MVEHSVGVWVVCVRRILFELCLTEQKKEKEEQYTEIFTYGFLDRDEKSWDSGAITRGTVVPLRQGLRRFKMTSCIIDENPQLFLAKGFQLYKSFSSLHCVYLGAAPIP